MLNEDEKSPEKYDEAKASEVGGMGSARPPLQRPRFGGAIGSNGPTRHGQLDPKLEQQWDEAEAAPESAPIPIGNYNGVLYGGGLFKANSGTDGFGLDFKITDSEFKDRRVSHTSWLTAPAMRYARRDLGKVGIQCARDLYAPLPLGLLCELWVVVEKRDDGQERNRVSKFEVIGRAPAPFEDPDFPTKVMNAEEARGVACDF